MSVATFGCRGRDGQARSKSRQQRWRVPRWGCAGQEALEVGCLRAAAAERIDGDADRGAADGEPEPDPQRDSGAGIEVVAGRRREADEDRCDHECRDRSEELDDCEYTLEVGGG